MVRNDLLGSSSCHWRLWNVHAENSSKIVQLALLGLSSLDAHWTHERVEALRKGGKALLLHVDTLEGVVVDALLVGEDTAARALECPTTHLLLPRLANILRLHQTTSVHEVVKATIIVLIVVDVWITSVAAERICLELGLLLTRSIVEPVRKIEFSGS